MEFKARLFDLNPLFCSLYLTLISPCYHECGTNTYFFLVQFMHLICYKIVLTGYHVTGIPQVTTLYTGSLPLVTVWISA